MTTNLVVADPTRTEKTICLAVSPSMKALGVKNRCRVFEIPKSIDYIMAPPRLKKYIDYSAEIYGTYLKYVSKDDILVYSIDEVFIDVTPYLKIYHNTAKEFAVFLMDEVTKKVGVRATAGIGTNLYLAKIALDITAKHSPDFIGILDEETYQETLWDHKPITDFWRVGRGTAKRLEKYGIYTMRGITEADEDLMHKVFGIDAELLIDHAWGYEPVTISDIKKYVPKSRSLSHGQVLKRDYSFDEAKLIVKEMTDTMCLELSQKKLITSSITLHIVYSNKLDIEPAHGTCSFDFKTNVPSEIIPKVVALYERIVDEDLPVRRLFVFANDTTPDLGEKQLSLFEIPKMDELKEEDELQKTLLNIKEKFGKNSVVKGMDLEEAATTIERNSQIGGHSSGEEN